MANAVIIDEDELDDGYTKGHMAAVKLNKDINAFIRESDGSSEWKCAFVLGYLDTMVAMREAIELELGDVEEDDKDVDLVVPEPN